MRLVTLLNKLLDIIPENPAGALAHGEMLQVIFFALLAGLSMALQSVCLPLEGIALIIGVDRILDMFRTAANVLGDIACTLVAAKSENEFDEKVYNSESNGDPGGATAA